MDPIVSGAQQDAAVAEAASKKEFTLLEEGMVRLEQAVQAEAAKGWRWFKILGYYAMSVPAGIFNSAAVGFVAVGFWLAARADRIHTAQMKVWPEKHLRSTLAGMRETLSKKV